MKEAQIGSFLSWDKTLWMPQVLGGSDGYTAPLNPQMGAPGAGTLGCGTGDTWGPQHPPPTPRLSLLSPI